MVAIEVHIAHCGARLVEEHPPGERGETHSGRHEIRSTDGEPEAVDAFVPVADIAPSDRDFQAKYRRAATVAERAPLMNSIFRNESSRKRPMVSISSPRSPVHVNPVVRRSGIANGGSEIHGHEATEVGVQAGSDMYRRWGRREGQRPPLPPLRPLGRNVANIWI